MPNAGGHVGGGGGGDGGGGGGADGGVGNEGGGGNGGDAARVPPVLGVTLVTQSTADRLWVLPHICARWRGLMVVASVASRKEPVLWPAPHLWEENASARVDSTLSLTTRSSSDFIKDAADPFGYGRAIPCGAILMELSPPKFEKDKGGLQSARR
eukprot:4244991-Pleurochrysis_carterae.AAC.3